MDVRTYICIMETIKHHFYAFCIVVNSYNGWLA